MEDYLNLTDEDKKNMIKSQLKNIQQQKYNLYLSNIQETALGNNNYSENLEFQQDELEIRESVLLKELNKFM